MRSADPEVRRGLPTLGCVTDSGVARRLRKAHRGRNREMGQGYQVRGHQAGVTLQSRQHIPWRPVNPSARTGLPPGQPMWFRPSVVVNEGGG